MDAKTAQKLRKVMCICFQEITHFANPEKEISTKSYVVVKTFDDYAHQIFILHVISQVQFVIRLDVLWDVCRSDCEWLFMSLPPADSQQTGQRFPS